MPSAVEIRVLKDAFGANVYRVAVGVGNKLSVVRDFRSKEEAKRFMRSHRERPPEGQKRG